MCGRYTIASKPETIEKKFLAQFTYQYEPIYNAAPSFNLPVILSEAPTKIQAVKWGFVPHWEQNIRKGYNNARGEGIHTSKAFLKSIRQRRCLVLANCFYEWGKTSKQPYLIHCLDQRLFALAGIYRPFVDKETGEVTNTFAIITTGANKLLTTIDHDRMPVILNPGNYRKWLNTEEHLANITTLAEQQYPYKKMNAHPVAKLVNSPSNNTKEVMEAIGDKVIQERIIYTEPHNQKIKETTKDVKTLGERNNSE